MTTSVQVAQHIQDLLAQGDLAGAEHNARRALCDDPDQFDVLHALGVIAQQRGAWDEAIKHLMRARALAPEHALAATHLAAALGSAERYDEALVHARNAVTLDPQLADAHYNLGVLLRRTEQLSDAVDAFRKTIFVDPSNAPAHRRLNILLDSFCDVCVSWSRIVVQVAVFTWHYRPRTQGDHGRCDTLRSSASVRR